MLGSFRSIERDLDFGDLLWHGDDGPLLIRRPDEAEMEPLQVAFLQAAAEVGHPSVGDHNAPSVVGAGRLPLNQLNGKRISCAMALTGAPLPSCWPGPASGSKPVRSSSPQAPSVARSF
ncbi:hypothetical protein HTZ77_38015 [Nonomuraea sp. SMC257]|uniref:Uncharacterized protein n=1 Tax=Nonomuraea montanisoli TaxID=2741721 RepID=A0A7Y6M8A1_9ACTN|nr:hypothetical protein [Nonomuraea montanisoli]